MEEAKVEKLEKLYGLIRNFRIAVEAQEKDILQNIENILPQENTSKPEVEEPVPAESEAESKEYAVMKDESIDLLLHNIEEILEEKLANKDKESENLLILKEIENIQQSLNAIKDKDLLFNRMYNELQDYKKGYHLNLFKPILSSLLQLNDNLANILSYQDVNPENKTDKELYILLKEEYKNVIFQIEDILAENGLIKYNGPLVGECFDPSIQTIKGIKNTEVQAENKMISEIITPGYKMIMEDGKELLFRKEYVEILKYNVQS